MSIHSHPTEPSRTALTDIQQAAFMVAPSNYVAHGCTERQLKDDTGWKHPGACLGLDGGVEVGRAVKGYEGACLPSAGHGRSWAEPEEVGQAP